MLARYQMKRGAKAADLPEGIRQDTRHHTQHGLRPPSELVTRLLAGTIPWEDFRVGYLAAVRERMVADRQPFDALAELARHESVHLGCSCPTKRQPHVQHCHTWLALELMQEAYPDLEIRFPDVNAGSS